MISEGKRHDVMQVLEDLAHASEKLSAGIGDGDGEAEAIRTGLRSIAKLALSERTNIDEPFRLGVVGMFKAGKSSVINTFLNRQVLREGLVEATAALTELRFVDTAEQEKGRIVYVDGTGDDMSLDAALEYTDVRSQAFTNVTTDAQRTMQDRIERIILHLNCELLRTVTLLDTPGFGGSVVGDRKAFAALARVDAALMIFPADRIGSNNELEVADFLSANGREVVALINKVDDGRGNPRAEAELSVSEAFVRDHFRTIAADEKGTQLIFRFSALEVMRALQALKNESTTGEQQRDARERLARWGYGGTGDSDAEKGVISFIRDRYFSSASTTVAERKLRGAKQTLLTAVEPMLGLIEQAEKNAKQAADAARLQHSEQRQRLLTEVEPKITIIEDEIRRIIAAQLDPFIHDIEEALLATLAKQAELDFRDLINAFRNQNALVAELQADFQANFPKWREEHLLKEIERQINRLLRNQWLFVLDEVQKIDASVVLPDNAELFRDINNAVRGSVVAAGAGLAAFLIVIFAPAGVIIALILATLADLVGFHFATRHQKRLREGERTIKLQLRNYAQQLTNTITEQAQKANDTLADKARHRIEIEVRGVDEKATAQNEAAVRWHVAQRELAGHFRALQNTEISVP